jgi:hypothetical protein
MAVTKEGTGTSAIAVAPVEGTNAVNPVPGARAVTIPIAKTGPLPVTIEGHQAGNQVPEVSHATH